MQAEMQAPEEPKRVVSLSEHESELRDALVSTPGYTAADWATSNLASVIHLAGEAQWGAQQHEARARALILLAVRLLRFSRATMAVAAAGWEIEARGMVRQVIEAHARMQQVAGDDTDATARQWLEGKPTTGIGAAVREAAPDLDPAAAKSMYSALSQDAHADVGAIMRTLTTVDDDLRAKIAWGPQRTDDARLTLLICATFTAEAATEIAVEARVDHPNRVELMSYLQRVSGALARVIERDVSPSTSSDDRPVEGRPQTRGPSRGP
jgi:hypothetical protein